MKILHFILSAAFFCSTLVFTIPGPSIVSKSMSQVWRKVIYSYVKQGTLPEGNHFERLLDEMFLHHYSITELRLTQGKKRIEKKHALAVQYVIEAMVREYKIVEGQEIKWPRCPFYIDGGKHGGYTCFPRHDAEEFSIDCVKKEDKERNQ